MITLVQSPRAPKVCHRGDTISTAIANLAALSVAALGLATWLGGGAQVLTQGEIGCIVKLSRNRVIRDGPCCIATAPAEV